MRTGRDMGHESSPCRLKPQTWTGSKEQRTMAPAPKCRLEKRDGRKSRIGEDEEGPRVKSQNLLGERLFTAVPAMEKSVKERPQNRPLDVISRWPGQDTGMRAWVMVGTRPRRASTGFSAWGRGGQGCFQEGCAMWGQEEFGILEATCFQVMASPQRSCGL